jgi:hypothetical protein
MAARIEGDGAVSSSRQSLTSVFPGMAGLSAAM